MNFIKTYAVLIIATILMASCRASEEKSKLNIAEYLAAATLGKVSPNKAQLAMLDALVPKTNYSIESSISQRSYWDNLANTTEGKQYLEQAWSWIKLKPEVPISDSIYRLANKEGNRQIYKPRYYRTMTRLEHFVLAECLENKGRFLPQIEVYIQAIFDMKSWLHPNHDNNANDVLEGRSMAIDLGSRRFGSGLALAKKLLENKLSSEVLVEIEQKLRTRIIDAYLNSTSGKAKTHNSWFKGTSNWNSVCTSGSVFVIISESKSHKERIAAIGTALNSMKNYLSGFGDDGYCSEGAGYWNYGFGHYLYLAQILFDYTNGTIDLFEFDNPEKLNKVANYPFRYQISEGVCAPFADGVSKVSDDGGFASQMVVRKYNASMPPYKPSNNGSDSYSAWFQLIDWRYMALEKNKSDIKKSNRPTPALPSYSYFDKFGMVISRGNQAVPLSIAVKAGHNRENHNHMDVGTYSIVLGSDIITGDVGAPSYTAGAFSDKNPVRSSWGHPVPIINNTLQSKGRKYKGVITKTQFTASNDKVVIDLKSAYKLDILNALVRTIENDKNENGTIYISDEFSLTKPADFGVAIMTLGNYEITNSNTVILKTKNQTLKAEVFSEDGTLEIKDELVPVKKLREGGPAYRIGVNFSKPLKKGKITIKFTPVFQ